MTTTTTHTLTISGKTYAGRFRLLGLGFTWNEESKAYAAKVFVDGEKISGPKFTDYDREFLLFVIRKHCKTTDLTITLAPITA